MQEENILIGSWFFKVDDIGVLFCQRAVLRRRIVVQEGGSPAGATTDAARLPYVAHTLQANQGDWETLAQ